MKAEDSTIEVRIMRSGRVLTVPMLLLSLLVFAFPDAAPAGPPAVGLLSAPDGWTAAEPPQVFLPDTLYEYINGAAENYLSYGFVELALGQYGGPDGAEMTVEIYDMGTPENAFGVYGSERYPDSRFLPLGGQGYIEEGVLNYFAGRFYVKLLAYPAGEGTEAALHAFADGVLRGIPDPGGFPLPVLAFPKAGLVENSEKFILRDFLGLAFLTRGTVASYRTAEGGAFEAFIVETESVVAAEKTRESLAGRFAPAGEPASGPEAITRLKDPYLDGILLVPAGRFLCGAMKVREGAAETAAAAERTVRDLARFLEGK